jgi:hypothetical protein
MGLDWLLKKHAAKAGRETEFHRITDKLAALDADAGLTDEQRTALRADLENALEQLAITPYEVIGAPRIGIDDKATEWFRKHCYQPAQERQLPGEGFVAHWCRPFEVVLADEHGKYVVELANDQRGLGAITGMLTSRLDFRGQAIGSAKCLPEHLKNEAYDEHDAEGSLDYATRLEAALLEVDDEHLEEVVDIRHGINWMRYWAERGFGWSPWF